MTIKTQAVLHRSLLWGGGLGLVLGFLIMLAGDQRTGFWEVMIGLVLILGGVATAFAKDKDGNERNVEIVEREELAERGSE